MVQEGWPDAPHRVLRVALDAAQTQRVVCADKPPTRDDTRPAADMAQYAGTGVGDITSSQSAHAVLHRPVGLPV
jgi:hypothetical protein